MNILLIQTLMYLRPHGGANKANRRLIRALAACGHRCHVLAPVYDVQHTYGKGAQRSSASPTARLVSRESASRQPPFDQSTGFVTRFRDGNVQVTGIAETRQLRSHVNPVLERLRPDIVLISTSYSDIFNAVIESAHCPVVALVHDLFALSFGPESTLGSDGCDIRLASGAISPSRFTQEYLWTHGSIDSPLTTPWPVYGAEPFRRLGSHQNEYITCINPCAVKGIDIFIQLARRFTVEHFRAIPLWGTTLQDLRAMSRVPNITVTNPEEEIETVLRDTRVLLMPSLWAEAFGISAVEAMLRGIPVIASNVGGLPEAKLGIPYVLPVNPITQYTTSPDDHRLYPMVPEQDISPWVEALRSLTDSRSHYDMLASQSHVAARRYAAQASISRVEKYLLSIQT